MSMGDMKMTIQLDAMNAALPEIGKIGIRRRSVEMYIHIGVGSEVVCFDFIGNPEPRYVEWATGRFHAFLCPGVFEHKEEAGMDNSSENSSALPSANGADGGGALCQHWYVAYTKSNLERRVAQQVNNLGFQTYVAIQKVWRQWSDRRKLMDKIVITQIVFVRCSLKDTEQIERLSYISYILRVPGTRTKAVIPDKQIDDLRTVVTNADESVRFSPDKFHRGDAVNIRFGRFAGVTGTVERDADGFGYLIVNVDFLGCAKVKIRATDLMSTK